MTFNPSKVWSVSCSVVSDSATPWTVCDSVHGDFPGKNMEWVAISFSLILIAALRDKYHCYSANEETEAEAQNK